MTCQLLERAVGDERFTEAASANAPWRAPGFWDEVRDEGDVETMRWSDYAAFVSPAGAAHEPDPVFAVELREHLRALVRRLYSS